MLHQNADKQKNMLKTCRSSLTITKGIRKWLMRIWMGRLALMLLNYWRAVRNTENHTLLLRIYNDSWPRCYTVLLCGIWRVSREDVSRAVHFGNLQFCYGVALLDARAHRANNEETVPKRHKYYDRVNHVYSYSYKKQIASSWIS